MNHKPPEEHGLPSVDLDVEVIEDLSPSAPPGFLRVVRRRLALRHSDGRRSEPFVYDEVDRRAIDAVVIAAHYLDHGVRHVYLRSAVRPPAALRDPACCPEGPDGPQAALWELPAGLIEAGDQDAAGVLRTAQRELLEELGFSVSIERFRRLGPSTFPAPGFIAERHYFFEVEVDPRTRREPTLDGSVLERAGLVVPLPLSEALSSCRTGVIMDSKTELGLRRLEEALA
jgi:ADP-ribose pyrophosphatase